MPDIFLSQPDFNRFTIPDRPSMPKADVADDTEGTITLTKSLNHCAICANFDFWYQVGNDDEPSTIADLLTADAAGKQATLAEYRAADGWFPLSLGKPYDRIYYKQKPDQEAGRIRVWEGK